MVNLVKIIQRSILISMLSNRQNLSICTKKASFVKIVGLMSNHTISYFNQMRST